MMQIIEGFLTMFLCHVDFSAFDLESVLAKCFACPTMLAPGTEHGACQAISRSLPSALRSSHP